MTNPTNPNRRPAGIPAGGQFAFRHRDEADLDGLDLHLPADVAVDSLSIARPADASDVGDTDHGSSWDSTTAPDTDEILAADPDTLWSYINSSNPFVRAEAATSPAVTDEQMAVLQRADQPFIVREIAAQVPRYGVAARASRDPDPVIRSLARTGFDLAPQDRARLDTDPWLHRLDELLVVGN